MSLEQLDKILATVPPLPPGQKAAVTDELLLRRFIGANASHYLEIYCEARAKNPARPLGAIRDWSWPAALLFLPWALYRKMWLFGGSVTIVGIILTLLFPAGTPIASDLPIGHQQSNHRDLLRRSRSSRRSASRKVAGARAD